MRIRLTAAVALVAFGAALLLPSVGAVHAWGDRDLAGPEWGLLADHGDATAAFTTPPSDAAPDHCAICHWLQGLGSSMHARVEPLPHLTAVPTRPGTTTLSIGAVYGLGCPARAPPSFLA